MSLESIEDMLETLVQFNNSEITLTFHNNHGVPQLSVCYLNNGFQLTCINQRIVLTYNDIKSTLEAIKFAMQNSFQEPLDN